MNYEEIEIETMLGKSKHLILTMADGTGKSFPADPENPEYVRFLEALEATEPEAE